MEAAGNLGPNSQIPPEEAQIIGAYILIAQQDGSHKKRSVATVCTDAWCLKHLANWLKQNANVPYGLNSLEKLGRHRNDDEVEEVLARFRQIPDVHPNTKKSIKAVVDVFRWIWHRIEDQLKKEKQAVENCEAARFAADLEAALVQTHQPVPEVSGWQADIMFGHMTQTREVGAAAMEDQAAFPAPEWNIPFDPPEMDVAFQDFEDMLIDDDFFEFTFDEEVDGRL